MSEFVIDDEKKKRIEDLVKSFKEIDAAILPFQEQRKELRESYIEEGWLTNEEFSYVKKAYNACKKNISMPDLETMVDIVKGEFPGYGNEE